MEPITLFRNQADCCGCGGCMTVCPANAITMEEDAQGCLYPAISRDLCLNCGKCLRVCQFSDPKSNSPLYAYAAVGMEENRVQNSASGGVFAMLAEQCLKEGGVVAGAVMALNGDRTDVFHMVMEDVSAISRMQGSKYVQSRGYACFSQVSDALKMGKTVLFSGTPCQVAAIKAVTGDPDNLLTLDLICHGTPPLKLFQDFISVLEKRLGGGIAEFQFRDKSAPKPFTAKISMQKGKKTYRLRSNMLSYYQYFLEGVTYRESCYHCPYAGTQRVSDLTMGDFWGIEKFHSEDMASGKMPARGDWSCLLVNTPKGERYLGAFGKKLARYATCVDAVAATNRQLTEPSQKPQKREAIMQGYAVGGYKQVEKEFVKQKGGAWKYRWRLWKAMHQK